jgi:hypothetical protein
MAYIEDLNGGSFIGLLDVYDETCVWVRVNYRK